MLKKQSKEESKETSAHHKGQAGKTTTILANCAKNASFQHVLCEKLLFPAEVALHKYQLNSIQSVLKRTHHWP